MQKWQCYEIQQVFITQKSQYPPAQAWNGGGGGGRVGGHG